MDESKTPQGIYPVNFEGKMTMKNRNEKGSIELIVLGLLAALIVVLAIPLLTSMGGKSETALSKLDSSMP